MPKFIIRKKLDFYIYRPKYFNLNDFVISSFPINFLRNKEINILKKFFKFSFKL